MAASHEAFGRAGSSPTEASRVAARNCSRWYTAFCREPYLLAITSPCSVSLMRPLTLPGGWARIARRVFPPPRPMAPPRPWKSSSDTP